MKSVCDFFFFVQAEDGIRDAQESRGLGDVYKRQVHHLPPALGGRLLEEAGRPDDARIVHELSLIHI